MRSSPLLSSCITRCTTARGTLGTTTTIRHLSKKRKSKSSRQWLDRHVKDPFVRQAQAGDKVSRSYYKLEFMDKKYNFFPNKNRDDNTVVVDLGAAPGGWTSYAADKQGVGHVVAIDLLELDNKIAGLLKVDFVQGDFTKLSAELEELLMQRSSSGGASLVMSDMAPNFMGDSRTDAMRTADLCEEALEFSIEILEPGGVFVGKYFSGPEEMELKEIARKEFTKVATVKPPASRKESSERYLVAQGRK